MINNSINIVTVLMRKVCHSNGDSEEIFTEFKQIYVRNKEEKHNKPSG